MHLHSVMPVLATRAAPIELGYLQAYRYFDVSTTVFWLQYFSHIFIICFLQWILKKLWNLSQLIFWLKYGVKYGFFNSRHSMWPIVLLCKIPWKILNTNVESFIAFFCESLIKCHRLQRSTCIWILINKYETWNSNTTCPRITSLNGAAVKCINHFNYVVS